MISAKKLTYENRYFFKHENIDLILEEAKKNTILVYKDTNFYRARLYEERREYDKWHEIEFFKNNKKIRKTKRSAKRYRPQKEFDTEELKKMSLRERLTKYHLISGVIKKGKI